MDPPVIALTFIDAEAPGVVPLNSRVASAAFIAVCVPSKPSDAFPTVQFALE